MENWKNVISTLAPTVASALLGPMGGAAVSAIGAIFGLSEPTQEKIAKAIESGQLTSEQLASLKELEMKLKAEEDERGFRYADLEFRNVQGARDRDSEITKSGGHNYRADAMFILAVVVICVLVWAIWIDPTINEFLKGIVTLVLGRFLGYLDNIYNFEYGTNRSSKSKDATISALSSK